MNSNHDSYKDSIYINSIKKLFKRKLLNNISQTKPDNRNKKETKISNNNIVIDTLLSPPTKSSNSKLTFESPDKNKISTYQRLIASYKSTDKKNQKQLSIRKEKIIHSSKKEQVEASSSPKSTMPILKSPKNNNKKSFLGTTILDLINQNKRNSFFKEIKINPIHGNILKILKRLILNTIQLISIRADSHLSITEQLIMELEKPVIEFYKEKNKSRVKYESETRRNIMKINSLLRAQPGFMKFINYNNIDDQSILGASSQITCEYYSKNDVIFHQNDKSTCFYGILRGKVDLIVSSNTKKNVKGKQVGVITTEKIAQLSIGNCFGEWGLIDNTTRRASAICSDEVVLFKVDQSCFNQYFKKCITKAELDRKHFIKNKINFFSMLSLNQFVTYFKSFVNLYLKVGDVVYDQSKAADSFFVLYQGECLCYVKNKLNNKDEVIVKYTSGSIFGLESLAYKRIELQDLQYNIDSGSVTKSKDFKEKINNAIKTKHSNKLLTASKEQLYDIFIEEQKEIKFKKHMESSDKYINKVISTMDNTVIMKFSFQAFNYDTFLLKEWLKRLNDEKNSIHTILTNNLQDKKQIVSLKAKLSMPNLNIEKSQHLINIYHENQAIQTIEKLIDERTERLKAKNSLSLDFSMTNTQAYLDYQTERKQQEEIRSNMLDKLKNKNNKKILRFIVQKNDKVIKFNSTMTSNSNQIKNKFEKKKTFAIKSPSDNEVLSTANKLSQSPEPIMSLKRKNPKAMTLKINPLQMKNNYKIISDGYKKKNEESNTSIDTSFNKSKHIEESKKEQLFITDKINLNTKHTHDLKETSQLKSEDNNNKKKTLLIKDLRVLFTRKFIKNCFQSSSVNFNSGKYNLPMINSTSRDYNNINK